MTAHLEWFAVQKFSYFYLYFHINSQFTPILALHLYFYIPHAYQHSVYPV